MNVTTKRYAKILIQKMIKKTWKRGHPNALDGSIKHSAP